MLLNFISGKKRGRAWYAILTFARYQLVEGGGKGDRGTNGRWGGGFIIS